jgi:hypothetical protein
MADNHRPTYPQPPQTTNGVRNAGAPSPGAGALNDGEQDGPRKKVVPVFRAWLERIRPRQNSIPEQQARCSSAFERSVMDIKFVVAHTNTGNLAVDGSSSITGKRVRELIHDALGIPCAVVEPSTIERIASAFEAWPPPAHEPQARWTPGFVLLCEGRSRVHRSSRPRRASSRCSMSRSYSRIDATSRRLPAYWITLRGAARAVGERSALVSIADSAVYGPLGVLPSAGSFSNERARGSNRSQLRNDLARFSTSRR